MAADRYGIDFGQHLRDVESIESSRYGRKQAKKKSARQDILNTRQDKEYAYGKGIRQKRELRRDVMNQREDEAYENSQAQQAFKQQKEQIVEFGSMINYIEKAPIMMRQKAWDDVRGSLSPDGQAETPEQYNQDHLDLIKSRLQNQAKELTESERLNREKFDYQKVKDAKKPIKAKEFKTADANTLRGLVMGDFATGAVEGPEGLEYRFPSDKARDEANTVLALADEIYQKGGISHIQAKREAKKQYKNKKTASLSDDELVLKYTPKK